MLYQLSYASPNTASHTDETASPPENLPRKPVIGTGTLPLRAYHGTVSKVSILNQVEQTAAQRPISLLFQTIWLDFGRSAREPCSHSLFPH
jgi:hypothetical protein